MRKISELALLSEKLQAWMDRRISFSAWTRICWLIACKKTTRFPYVVFLLSNMPGERGSAGGAVADRAGPQRSGTARRHRKRGYRGSGAGRAAPPRRPEGELLSLVQL